jgi:hypothetical protein
MKSFETRLSLLRMPTESILQLSGITQLTFKDDCRIYKKGTKEKNNLGILFLTLFDLIASQNTTHKQLKSKMRKYHLKNTTVIE